MASCVRVIVWGFGIDRVSSSRTPVGDNLELLLHICSLLLLSINLCLITESKIYDVNPCCKVSLRLNTKMVVCTQPLFHQGWLLEIYCLDCIMINLIKIICTSQATLLPYVITRFCFAFQFLLNPVLNTMLYGNMGGGNSQNGLVDA